MATALCNFLPGNISKVLRKGWGNYSLKDSMIKAGIMPTGLNVYIPNTLKMIIVIQEIAEC